MLSLPVGGFIFHRVCVITKPLYATSGQSGFLIMNKFYPYMAIFEKNHGLLQTEMTQFLTSRMRCSQFDTYIESYSRI